MKNRILLLIAAFALPLFMQANNIRVKLNSYNPSTKQLNVTLAWDNSWHDGSTQFRDAAWLFVKYKDITNPEWVHGALATPTAANNVVSDTLNTPNVKFDVIARKPISTSTTNTGYIIRRKAGTGATQNSPEFAGVYNVAMDMNITLVLPAGVTLANPEFRVYALEMVDIPTGSFWVGDGSPASGVKANLTTNAPVNINSATAPVSCFVNGMAKTIGGTYPNGFAEYYMMKYELSNEGYCEFMNTLTRQQQNALAEVPAFATQATSYQGLFNSYSRFAATFTSLTDPAVFGSDGNYNGTFNEANDAQNNGVVVNYMRSVLAYLDWAGLRPASGFEFEKACRGPLSPIQGEYAWGSTTGNSAIIDVDIFGANEGSSIAVNGPLSSGGLRNGVFARPSGSTRLSSGGSYYGIMELSNSCAEAHTGYGENPIWETWTGTNGDGMVNTNYSSLDLASTSGTVSYWSTYRNADFGVYGSLASGSVVINYISQGIRGVIK